MSREFYPSSGEKWYELTYENGKVVKKVEYTREGTVVLDHDFTAKEKDKAAEEIFHYQTDHEKNIQTEESIQKNRPAPLNVGNIEPQG